MPTKDFIGQVRSLYPTSAKLRAAKEVIRAFLGGPAALGHFLLSQMIDGIRLVADESTKTPFGYRSPPITNGEVIAMALAGAARGVAMERGRRLHEILSPILHSRLST